MKRFHLEITLSEISRSISYFDHEKLKGLDDRDFLEN